MSIDKYPKVALWASLKSLPPLIQEIWQTSAALFCSVIALRVVIAVLPVFSLAVAGLLIDAINLANRFSSASPKVWRLLAIEIGIALGSGALQRLLSHYDLLLSDRFSLKINLKLIDHCNNLDLESFEDAGFQDRMQRARSQISSQVALLKNLLQALQQLISIAGMVVSALLVAPGLIAVQLLGVLPVVMFESNFARRRYLMSRERTPVKRLMDYILFLVSGGSAVKEVKLFSLGSFLYEQYRSAGEQHHREDFALSLKATRMTLLLVSLGTLIYYATYAILIREALMGTFSIGRLVFLAGLLQGFRGQLAAFLGSLTQGFDQLLYVGDVIEVFAEKPRLVSIGSGRPIPQLITQGIEFRNVSFIYSDGVTAALNNVSFRIRPGEIVALVGENGAGKSTIIKLITRLYDPSKGQIFLDGIDLREFNAIELRSLMTSVFQDYVRYDLSVSANIAVGDIAARRDSERIAHVAEKTGASAFISTMPEKYDQILGKRFANSVDLSGGQWQRLALARSYMRDAQIIILDEPTAAVDARAEAALYEDAIRVGTGKMTVLVTHRLSTVRFADRILVLKNGSVCEDGTHDELMAEGGEYCELFTLQATGYR